MLISCIIVSPLYIRCVICCSPYEFIKQIILRQLTVPEESPIELPAILVEIELEKSLIHFLMNSLYCTTTFSSYYMYPRQNLSHHLMHLSFRFPIRFMTEQLSQSNKICPPSVTTLAVGLTAFSAYGFMEAYLLSGIANILA